MKRFFGGNKVYSGIFLDADTWRPFVVGKEGLVLPGDPEHRYFRLNPVEALVFVLGISALYVLFIPFIGFPLVLIAVGISLATIVSQKLGCGFLQRLCETRDWICDLVNNFFRCKSCGKDCHDYKTMIRRAVYLGLFAMILFLVAKYLHK